MVNYRVFFILLEWLTIESAREDAAISRGFLLGYTKKLAIYSVAVSMGWL